MKNMLLGLHHPRQKCKVWAHESDNCLVCAHGLVLGTCFENKVFSKVSTQEDKMKFLKTALALAVVSASAWSSDLQEEFKWTRTYTLTGGGEVTHTPDGVVVKMGGLNMKMGGGYKFSRGSCLNDLMAVADGHLKVAQTQAEFRAEVAKLGGAIISEK
ncbi:MAG: hypothetical protein C0514_07745 [Candidatus Puniceispirillum sp.]|nr:hypothetical protein [Candidatus Puniceispirillum sp.]